MWNIYQSIWQSAALPDLHLLSPIHIYCMPRITMAASSVDYIRLYWQAWPTLYHHTHCYKLSRCNQPTWLLRQLGILSKHGVIVHCVGFPLAGKTKTHLSCIFSIIFADGLVTLGARASVGMLLTLIHNIPVSTKERLSVMCTYTELYIKEKSLVMSTYTDLYIKEK